MEIQAIARLVDYGWTTGGNSEIRHQRIIDIGGFGEVHQVHYPSSISLQKYFADLVYIDAK